VIAGPLGTEAEFKEMNDVANTNDVQIIVDVVLNHTVDISEVPTGLVKLDGSKVSDENFPQFSRDDFHERCEIGSDDGVQKCWLSGTLLDLKTEDDHVRGIARDYLEKLSSLGVDGYRFDAAVHIEPGFYPAVLSATPDKFAFGEIIREHPSEFSNYLAEQTVDFYDFPLVSTIRRAFAFGGDLRDLRNPKGHDGALDGPRAITFVRNHDIDRGQNDDRGLTGDGRNMFGIGWDEGQHKLDRTDVQLAYAFVLSREDGLPYVFADMNTLPQAEQDDLFDDPFVVAGIRFHNLSLADTGGVARRPEVWRIETHDAIGWQRGDDRFIVINKAASWFAIDNLGTSLQPGEYKEIRTGWPMHVQSDGQIRHWDMPPRSAMMFVRVGG
jgi:alpha-amylase